MSAEKRKISDDEKICWVFILASTFTKPQRFSKRLPSIGIHFILLILLNACSSTKSLQPEELLYTKTNIKFTNPEQFNKKATVRADLLALARPVPNAKNKLRFYNWLGVPKKDKGVRHWLRRVFGEPPVLYDPLLVKRTERIFEKYLNDNGYFGAIVESDTIVNNKEVAIDYQLTSRGRHYIRSVHFPSDTTEIGRLVLANLEETYLKAEKPYELATLDKERLRLANVAGNQGFLNFNEKHIYFIVDTTAGPLQADLYVRVKPPSDSTRHHLYSLNQTYIFPDHSLETSSQAKPDTIHPKDGFTIIQNTPVLRPATLARIVTQNKNDWFSKKLQNATFNRLVDLDLFKFVNIKYEPVVSEERYLLDRYLYLSPNKIQDITAELELNNRTGRYFGTAATFTYTHKNLFGGAERLDVSLSGGIETQLDDGLSFVNTSDVNAQVNLSVPHFITPFKIKNISTFYLPRTLLSLSTVFQRRTGFYSINNAQLRFGYKWRETPKVRNELYPINFNLFRLLNSTDKFQELLNTNSRLEKSFEDVFTAGLKYTYVYSDQFTTTKRTATYFKSELETSGNALRLLFKVIEGSSELPYGIADLPFSQYVRLDGDFRFYQNFQQNRLATRAYAGIGIPYGNAQELPYSRQFIIGGANSVRAFRLRALGPGSFVADSTNTDGFDNQFIDQTGDIKLELNVEYRFPIFSYLKGALFVDAGNVWLLRENEQQGGVFELNRFYKEIAIGTGFGMRLDFDFFVIRLDTAFALRRPYQGEGFKWSFQELAFLNRSWRKENVIWNLGIGYPF